MQTLHSIHFGSANNMKAVEDGAIDLVVTSPPYPMIEMWDEPLIQQDPAIEKSLEKGDGEGAFERMHQVLDKVWDEVARVLKPGGIACINIGDATRTINDRFMLYPNHSRIITYLATIGLSTLPAILWRKPTNAPNKFMGSGMMPPGAYVTLEHEYVLIFRKGNKREFTSAKLKDRRRESAFFWEERNQWFSDVWMDLVGTTQSLKAEDPRLRSAAYPFELPYRLINMFSIKGDTVLDPFLGLGTTMLAAMAAARNSVGYEIEKGFLEPITSRLDGFQDFANNRIHERFENHVAFVAERHATKGGFKHQNFQYGFPVVTLQEKALLLNELKSIRPDGKQGFAVDYSDSPQEGFVQDYSHLMIGEGEALPKKHKKRKKADATNTPKQSGLFE